MPRNKYKELKHVDPDSEDYKRAVDELVDIVRSQPDTRTYALDDDIQNFIEDLHIKTGTYKVPNFIIYYEYLKWEGILDTEGAPKHLYEEFFYRFAKKFKGKRTNVGMNYQLNQAVFGKYDEISDEELMKIKELSLHYRTGKLGRDVRIPSKRVLAHGEKEKAAKKAKQAASSSEKENEILKEEEEDS